MSKMHVSAAAVALAGVLAGGGALAQTVQPHRTPATGVQVPPAAVAPAAPTTVAPTTGTSQAQPAQPGEAREAKELVRDAAKTIADFNKDPEFRNLAKGAKGIFVIPTLVRGSLIVGGQGGEAVLLAHVNGKWSDPVFYNMGSISIGLQAGGAAGRMAFLLMTPKAVQAFTEQNNFSLNANADLTIVNYAAQAQGNVGKGDIIVYSDLTGLSGGFNVSGTDIVRDDEETRNYYGRAVTAQQVLGGQVHNPDSKVLTSRLPG